MEYISLKNTEEKYAEEYIRKKLKKIYENSPDIKNDKLKYKLSFLESNRNKSSDNAGIEVEGTGVDKKVKINDEKLFETTSFDTIKLDLEPPPRTIRHYFRSIKDTGFQIENSISKVFHLLLTDDNRTNGYGYLAKSRINRLMTLIYNEESFHPKFIINNLKRIFKKYSDLSPTTKIVCESNVVIFGSNGKFADTFTIKIDD